MTTHDPGLRLAIVANPTDAGLYEILADWLETTDAGRCDPLWSVRVDRQLLPYAQTPPYRMRLTAKCLRLMDERSHGEGPCDCSAHNVGCLECDKRGYAPTFELLMDEPGNENCEKCRGKGTVKSAYIVKDVLYIPRGSLESLKHQAGAYANLASISVVETDLLPEARCDSCNGTGKKAVPGHASQFVAYLREMEDKRAEQAGLLRVAWCGNGSASHWVLDDGRTGEKQQFFYTFVDNGSYEAAYVRACREWIRRLLGIVTTRCPLAVKDYRIRSSARNGQGHQNQCYAKTRMPGTRRRNCKVCLNLGWVATYPEE